MGVTTERRWQDQAEALLRLGARVVHGPVVGPIPLARREALEAIVDDLVRHPPVVTVFTNGAALESWLGAGEHLGSARPLREVTEAARVVVGTGAAAGAREAGMVVAAEIATAPAAVTAAVAELRATSAPGARIAVQLAERFAGELVAALRADGFDVVAVPNCPREPPDDLRPAFALVEGLIDGRIDAVTFTEAAEVDNLVAIAASADLDAALVEALGDRAVAACLGASSAAAAAASGIGEVVRPAVSRPGAMVDALAARLEGAVVRLRLNGVEVEARGLLALVGDAEVWLTERERSVLSILARRPGAVVAKDELLRRVWRSDGVDGAVAHAVEVAVARLRRRLGPAGAGLITVPRRGYRLVPG